MTTCSDHPITHGPKTSISASDRTPAASRPSRVHCDVEPSRGLAAPLLSELFEPSVLRFGANYAAPCAPRSHALGAKGRIPGFCTRTRPAAPRHTCRIGRGRNRCTRDRGRGTSRTRARRIADSRSRAPNDRARCRAAWRDGPARRHSARCLQDGGGHSHALRSEWRGRGGRQAWSAGGAGAMPRARANDLGGLEARSAWRCPPAGRSSLKRPDPGQGYKRPVGRGSNRGATADPVRLTSTYVMATIIHSGARSARRLVLAGDGYSLASAASSSATTRRDTQRRRLAHRQRGLGHRQRSLSS